MLWIKRHLMLVGFGLVACGLLGVGLFYLWTSRGKNKEKEEQVEQAKQELEALLRGNPSPNASNITLARAELERVTAAIGAAKEFYQPIPFENVTNQQPFKTLLNKTIFELQQDAQKYGVELPKAEYAFSFEAQQKQLHPFAPGTFPTLPEQLAEIKTISGVLFESKINKLINVKRWRVTVDDPPGSADYHDTPGNQTNAVTETVGNFYEVAFHSFSGELAAVLQGFYRSPHGFTVKTISVEPVPQTGQNQANMNPQVSTTQPQPNAPRVQPPPVRPQPGRPHPNPIVPVRAPPTTPRPGAPPAPARDALQTVLNEQLLNVIMKVEVVKSVK